MFPYEDSKTVSVCPYLEKRNHPGLVNISPTLLIDASMERSSQVLQHGKTKIWIFFQKSSKFKFWLVTKSFDGLRQYQSYIGTNWYINGKVFTSTTPWKPKKIWFFFKKFRNWQNWILSIPWVSVPREKKLPWLRQYQSYISNWYINGRVFTSTTAW